MSLQKYHSGMMNMLIASGRIDQWSRYMTGGRYTDAVQVGNYMIETQEDDRDIRFLLWNPHRPCITMTIDKSDNTASMDGIEYNPECTVSGRMKRGDGTRDMITTALMFLKQHGAVKVRLSDNSYILCNGKRVKLGLMSFFKHGKTWYEKYFGFRPEEKYMKQYTRAKQLQKTLNLSDKPCDYFTEEVTDKLIADLNLVFFFRITWEKDL